MNKSSKIDRGDATMNFDIEKLRQSIKEFVKYLWGEVVAPPLVYQSYQNTIRRCVYEIESLMDVICKLNTSTVDAVPVVHGEWAINEFGHFCTSCKEYVGDPDNDCQIAYRYCPNCGAKMASE